MTAMSGGKGKMGRPRNMRSTGAGNDWTPDSKEKAAHPNSPFRHADAQQSGARSGGGKRRRRADQRHHFWRTPQRHDAARFSGARLGARHLCRRDDGFGNNRRCDWRSRSGAPRSDGDAAVLRLQHGPLFSALARDRSAPDESAAHFPRKLVPQRCRRKIPVARLRRQHARAEMDH